MEGERTGELPSPVTDNIETISRLHDEALAGRSAYEKVTEALGSGVGRVSFIVVHLLWFAVWAAFNTALVPGLPAFDPYPFSLFGTLVSLEGVMITALVLIKQERMSRLAERRAHVELQVTLLAERETTHLLRMMERVMAHLGLEDEQGTRAQGLSEHTAVEEIAHAVRESLPE